MTSRGQGMIHLLVEDDPAAARDALAAVGIDVTAEREVLVVDVEDAPGALGSFGRSAPDASTLSSSDPPGGYAELARVLARARPSRGSGPRGVLRPVRRARRCPRRGGRREPVRRGRATSRPTSRRSVRRSSSSASCSRRAATCSPTRRSRRSRGSRTTSPRCRSTRSARWSSRSSARLSNVFESFDEEPIASASLGQVHHAVLRDGRRCAVKVQRPGIRETIDRTSRCSSLAEFLDDHTEVGERYHFGEMIDEFERSLIRELDYRREAVSLGELRGTSRAFEAAGARDRRGADHLAGADDGARGGRRRSPTCPASPASTSTARSWSTSSSTPTCSRCSPTASSTPTPIPATSC
jgi:hypothetical protein